MVEMYYTVRAMAAAGAKRCMPRASLPNRQTIQMQQHVDPAAWFATSVGLIHGICLQLQKSCNGDAAGAYTTSRTIDGNAVFDLQHHIERLATSAQLMHKDDCEVLAQLVLPYA